MCIGHLKISKLGSCQLSPVVGRDLFLLCPFGGSQKRYGLLIAGGGVKDSKIESLSPASDKTNLSVRLRGSYRFPCTIAHFIWKIVSKHLPEFVCLYMVDMRYFTMHILVAINKKLDCFCWQHIGIFERYWWKRWAMFVKVLHGLTSTAF